MNANFVTPRGKKFRLGQKLGSGKEAIIYEVVGTPHKVAKIYQQGTTPNRDKIEAMVRMGTPHPAIAWPEDLLLDASGDLAGFTMRRIEKADELHDFFNPLRGSNPNLHRAWHVAYQIAEIMSACHQHNLVIGDVNARNILVTPSDTVAWVDADSFQVPSGRKIHYCEVCVPCYLAPELIGADFKTTERPIHVDTFALAVLVAQILLLGCHPFAGGDAGPPKEKIEDGTPWLWGAIGGPTKAPKPQPVVGDDVLAAFDRAFGTGLRQPDQRPAAMAWCQLLRTGLNNLVPCPRHNQHYHLGKGPCYWCQTSPNAFGPPTNRRAKTARPPMPPPATAVPQQPLTWRKPVSLAPYLGFAMLVLAGFALFGTGVMSPPETRGPKTQQALTFGRQIMKADGLLTGKGGATTFAMLTITPLNGAAAGRFQVKLETADETLSATAEIDETDQKLTIDQCCQFRLLSANGKTLFEVQGIYRGTLEQY
ncbi:protein kinase domain-containing protein [Acanthopleuribacter pedis]|uniref:Protein kinase n=1 Tax=Acanthopleuribacter pedis TaxID=442870 RepID=A0A8J7U7Z7_9BACT|nr:protein kinase [Acanthopleuribacter pedis]MBO1321936.1 protein kinase [Acanthopleuribacter pedis]